MSSWKGFGESFLVEDKYAKKIVDLGKGDLIPENLEDRDMVQIDGAGDVNMEIVHYEGNFSFAGYSDEVLIPLEDQSSIQMTRGDMFVLFYTGDAAIVSREETKDEFLVVVGQEKALELVYSPFLEIWCMINGIKECLLEALEVSLKDIIAMMQVVQDSKQHMRFIIPRNGKPRVKMKEIPKLLVYDADVDKYLPKVKMKTYIFYLMLCFVGTISKRTWKALKVASMVQSTLVPNEHKDHFKVLRRNHEEIKTNMTQWVLNIIIVAIRVFKSY
jgi:hypothetical protein